MTRAELRSRVWALVEPTIHGYSKLISRCLSLLSIEQLRLLVRELGDEDDEEDYDDDVDAD